MPIFHKPKYSTVQVKKKDIPQGLWQKCPQSGEIIYNKELEQNQFVVPKSGYHFPIKSKDRVRFLLDEGTWEEKDAELKQLHKKASKKASRSTKMLKSKMGKNQSSSGEF